MPLTSNNNQTNKQKGKANKPFKQVLVARQTNEFIDLHVYVDYTIVQQPLSIHGCLALLASRNSILD